MIVSREGFHKMTENREYVEQLNGAFWVTGTRVSLDSIVYAFLRGSSPESIVRSFPTISLEQVYGAINFYLAHEEEIDAYLKNGETEFEKIRQTARAANPLFYAKLQDAHGKAE